MIGSGTMPRSDVATWSGGNTVPGSIAINGSEVWQEVMVS